MISTHDCINQIEVLLDSGGTVGREQLAGLVWAYAKACQQLNEKALQCLELLRQGRRAEARQLAKEPPDLEQELRLLDFPARAAWLDLCEGAGTPISQSLDLSALEAIIQDVYGEAGRLDTLLRSYRRMSLGHAPLPDRLRTLRRLREADPDHDHWSEDVRTFEVAWLTELVKEAEAADVAGNLQVLERILAELRSGEWMTPPARHIAAVDKVAAPHRRRYAFAQFGELVRDLHEAHSGMDEARCRELLERWQGVIRQTGVQPDASMAEGIAPVQAWLADLEAARAEDKAFAAACAALEQAIDENKDRPALEHLAGAVFRFERGMPELLAARFNTRMEEINRRGRRRFALALTAVIGGLALVAAGVTVLIMARSRQVEREQWQTQIAGALDKGDLAGTGKLLQSLAEKNPEIRSSPEILALERTHAQKTQEESDRIAEFQRIREGVEKAGPDAPDEAALKRGEELARTLEEKQWAQAWRQKYAKADDDRRRQREDAFREQLARLKTLHAALSQAEQDRRDDLDALAAPVLELAGQLTAAKDVSEGLVAEARAIENHTRQALRTFAESADKRKAAQGVLTRLPTLTDSPEELASALSLFVEKYAEHRLAPEFAKAARMGPHWRSAQAWRALAEGWGNQVRLNAPAAIATRRQQVEEYLKVHPYGPFSPAARDYLSYLRTATAAFPGGRLVGIDKVIEVLNHVVFTPSVLMIRANDGRAFYLLKKDLKEQRVNDKVVGYNWNYLISMSMASNGPVSLSVDQIEEGPAPAPQSVCARAALDRLSRVQEGRWETAYLEVASLVMEQKGMDPVLTGQVLQLVLGFAASSTPYKTDQIKRYVDQIGMENLDFVAWLDPGSESGTRVRPRMTQLLTTIGPLKTLVTEVQKDLDAMAKSLCPCRPVGILLGERDEVQFTQPPADGTLYVLWGAGGQAPTFHEVGTVQGGRATVVRGMTAPYPQGTPVFMRKG